MLVLPAAAFAASSASLSFSGETEAHAGDTFVLSVTFKASEEISALQAEFTYDDSLISFVSDSNIIHGADGTGGITDNPGEAEVEYSLSFRALKAGVAGIDITNAELISAVTGKKIGNPAGSVEIEITEAPVVTEPTDELILPQPTPTPPPEADVPAEDTESTLMIGGKTYILTEKELPGDYQLLGDENGDLWLWAQGEDSLTEYRTASVDSLYFFPEQPELSDLEKTSVPFADGTIRELYTAETADVYYAWLQDATGECHWYRYDAQDNTLQKAVTEHITVEEPAQDDPTQHLIDTLSLILLVGVILAAAILLIVIFRRKR